MTGAFSAATPFAVRNKEGTPMTRFFLFSAIFLAAIFFFAATTPTTAIADNGNAGTTASFFSGGAGAHVGDLIG